MKFTDRLDRKSEEDYERLLRAAEKTGNKSAWTMRLAAAVGVFSWFLVGGLHDPQHLWLLLPPLYFLLDADHTLAEMRALQFTLLLARDVEVIKKLISEAADAGD